MKNVTLTRGEATLFVALLLAPMLVIGGLALIAFPELRWMLPTSMLCPAGLLIGIGLRGGPATAR